MRLRFLLYAIALVTVAVLSYMAHQWPYFWWDLELVGSLQSLELPGLVPLMELVSVVGSTAGVLTMTGLLLVGLWLSRCRLEAIFVLLTLSADLVARGVKLLVARPRPDEGLVQVMASFSSDLSFPSGHVVQAVVLLGFAYFLASVAIGSKPRRWIIKGMLGAFIVLMGLSRVYLGAHWPSDVLAGYLIGGLMLAVLIATYRSLAPRRRYDRYRGRY